jgi:fumarate hydratase, class II
MLVTAPVIGYDKASAIAHHAMEHDLTLKDAALQLGYVDEATFDRAVDPARMVKSYVANTPVERVRIADRIATRTEQSR